jgi:hypothetical protein
MITEATVATPHGLAYTRRLCKHFAHKIPVTVEGNQGRLEFQFGLCTIENDDEFMRIVVDVPDAAELDRAEDVVARHLIRMANKDEPVVTWERHTPD